MAADGGWLKKGNRYVVSNIPDSTRSEINPASESAPTLEFAVFLRTLQMR